MQLSKASFKKIDGDGPRYLDAGAVQVELQDRSWGELVWMGETVN